MNKLFGNLDARITRYVYIIASARARRRATASTAYALAAVPPWRVCFRGTQQQYFRLGRFHRSGPPIGVRVRRTGRAYDNT